MGIEVDDIVWSIEHQQWVRVLDILGLEAKIGLPQSNKWVRHTLLTFEEVRIPKSARTRSAHPNLKVDAKVLARFTDGRWNNLHFAGWTTKGQIRTFQKGQTSWTACKTDALVTWDEWKLPDEVKEEKNDG